MLKAAGRIKLTSAFLISIRPAFGTKEKHTAPGAPGRNRGQTERERGMITTTSTAGSGRSDRSAHLVTPEPNVNGGCVLTIGVFDGFHLGHQQLVARTVLEAGRKHVPAVLITFDPHPLAIVDCSRAPHQLMTVDQRIEYARAAGIDEVVVMPFTPSLAGTTAEEFAIEVLVDRFRMRSIVVGQNFRFGRDNKGDVALLDDIGSELGFDTIALPMLLLSGRPCSSTQVRQALQTGDLDLARQLLGRAERTV